MPFPVLGSNSAVAGFEIDNSLRFNDDDNAYLARTPGSSGSRTIATVSFWVKRGNLKASGNHFMLEASSSTSPFNMTRVRFGDDLLIIDNTLDGNAANGFYFQSDREYRDPSAWYHIFFSIDVTQANATDGWLLYVNGVQQTKALTYWVQNANLEFSQSSVQMNIGRRHDNTTDNFDGYLAEYHYIDGTRKLYTDFGEFNDNGVWVPKAYDGGSYGTNGFFLEFQNSGALGTDTSGNGNNFTPTNLTATDQTTDTPTNNFATLNALNNFEGATLSEGNTKAVTPAGSQNGLVPATMGVQNGKWYWEVKVPTTNYVAVGIIADDKLDKAFLTGANSSTRIVKGDDGTKFSSNTSGGSYMAAYEGSILQVALNLDDGEITFGAGGSWANGSGLTNQTFATSTPAYTDLNSSSDFTNKFILPVVSDENQGTSDTFEMNFGNPSFTISSGNSDANGYGNFEYAVPSGYYALCTKNLAEYG